MNDFRVFRETDLLGVDIESKDPNLVSLGPGCYRGDGYITGVSFATDDVSVYLDIAHPDTTAETKERNLRIIADLCSQPNEKVGANILYDLDWLGSSQYRIQVNGKINDVQYAEPLLDEYRTSYSLASLASHYHLTAKATNMLEGYCRSQQWKLTKETPAAAYIWQMPSSVVRHYAELDSSLAVQILRKQKLELQRQGLMDIYDIEVGLIPLLLRMRQQGVRIDTPRYRKVSYAVADKLFELKNAIYEWAGEEFNIGSTAQLAELFDKRRMPYPRNEPTGIMKEKGLPGNPCLDKETLTQLSKNGYEICRKILQYRHYETLCNMFLIPYADFMVGDRLHCQFHPLRSDDYGAVSGRFSSSKPNLQQVSAQQDDDFSDGNPLLKGQILRGLFIPEEDHLWAKLDYSQVEYRIGAHYASGPGAEELRKEYNDNPNTDYHQRIQDLTGFDRRTSKRLNFGASYGMGYKTAAKKFYWSEEEAEMFMEGYHRAAPYLKITRKSVVERAERRGFIFTLLGRRARVHPSRKLHSLYNRLIQGSAADIMKKAMVDSWKLGVYDVLKPHLTVHDELDVSVPQTKEGTEALELLKHTMEHCVTLKVPLIADCHVANNWAEAD